MYSCRTYARQASFTKPLEPEKILDCSKYKHNDHAKRSPENSWLSNEEIG